MLALVLFVSMVDHKKVVHYDLGRVDHLTLTADFDVAVTYSQPNNVFAYKAHFLAKDQKGTIVDQKHVDFGSCFGEPNSFVIADHFGKGYKQVFISLHLSAIQSYLFAFRDRKFYAAYANEEGRTYTEVRNSGSGAWRIWESEPVRNRGRWPKKARVTKTMVYMTTRITPTMKPIIH